jgi:heptosyltransferase II
MYYIIYQTAFIGDIVLSTSMINTIKQADPKSKIIFVTTPVGESVLRNDKRIERVIFYDKRARDNGMTGLLKKVKEIRDCIDREASIFISPHRFMRASLIGYLSGSKVRAGFKGSFFSLLFNRRIPYRFGIHEIQRNFDLLCAAFGQVFPDLKPERPEIFFSKKDYMRVKNAIYKIFSPKDKIVSIAPGSVWPTKKWPAEYFMELIHALDALKIKVILIGGKEDRELCDSLGYRNTLNLAGELSLPASAAAISLSRVLVSNDSAPLHLASAVNTPAVAIFGATTPHFGFGPLADGSAVLESDGLACRPCGRHGAKRCAKKHFACMKSITAGRVKEAVMKIID